MADSYPFLRTSSSMSQVPCPGPPPTFFIPRNGYPVPAEQTAERTSPTPGGQMTYSILIKPDHGNANPSRVPSPTKYSSRYHPPLFFRKSAHRRDPAESCNRAGIEFPTYRQSVVVLFSSRHCRRRILAHSWHTILFVAMVSRSN